MNGFILLNMETLYEMETFRKHYLMPILVKEDIENLNKQVSIKKLK